VVLRLSGKLDVKAIIYWSVFSHSQFSTLLPSTGPISRGEKYFNLLFQLEKNNLVIFHSKYYQEKPVTE
jgi:hypothetical protein